PTHVRSIVPLHPRGRDRLLSLGFADHDAVRVVDPLGYVEFMSLVRGARAVITDSGGVQEETTVLGVPCLTLRPNTERPITIHAGTTRLVPPHPLVDELDSGLARRQPRRHSGATTWRVPPLWDGRAGGRIGDIVVDWLGESGRGSNHAA